MLQKFKTWSERPLTCKFGGILFYILFALIVFANMTEIMDADSHYMLAQGREILATKSLPEYNTFTYYKDFRIILQQWVYIIIMTILHDYLGNWAIILFGTLQAMLLCFVCEKYMCKYVRDKAVARFMSGLLLVTLFRYTFYMRPENLTLILLLCECMVLEKYRDTKQQKWLALMPILMLIEANAHCTMWMFHFCILLAYCMPDVIDMIFHVKLFNKDTHLKWDDKLAFWTLATFAAAFLNPYGVDNLLYPLYSLRVFEHVHIVEQAPTEYMTTIGFILLCCIIVFVLLLSRKKIDTVTFYLSLGFFTLATFNYHSFMFTGIAILFLATRLLEIYESKNPELLMNVIPNAAWIGIVAAFLITGFMFTYAMRVNYPNFDKVPEIDAMIEVMNENGPGNIYCDPNTGSYLEAQGFRNVAGDTRPELWLEKINGTYNADIDFAYMTYGLRLKNGPALDYTPDDYLKEHDIKYVILCSHTEFGMYLHGWIDNSDDYSLIYRSENPNDSILYMRND